MSASLTPSKRDLPFSSGGVFVALLLTLMVVTSVRRWPIPPTQVLALAATLPLHLLALLTLVRAVRERRMPWRLLLVGSVGALVSGGAYLLFSRGPVAAAWMSALLLSLRMLVPLGLGLAVLVGLGSAGVARGLEQLRLPPTLIDIVRLTLRAIETIGEERVRMERALRSRAGVATRRQRIMAQANLLAALFERSMGRSRCLEQAQQSRLAAAPVHPSLRPRFRRADVVLTGLPVFAVLVQLAPLLTHALHGGTP